LDDIVLEVVFPKELISLHPEVVREEGVYPELTNVLGETK
jgi:hypothetical protein